MKNLIFGFLATVMFVFVGNAQTKSNDVVRLEYAKGMVNFIESLRPAYTDGISFTEFKRRLNVSDKSLSPEGAQLLLSAHTFLNNKVPAKEILEKGDVRPLINASLYITSYNRSSQKKVGDQILFGIENSTDLPANLKYKECKWYQIGCHLSNIFNWVVDHYVEIGALATNYCLIFGC